MAKRKFVLGRFILFLMFLGSCFGFYYTMSQKITAFNYKKENNMRALINYFDFRDKDFYKTK